MWKKITTDESSWEKELRKHVEEKHPELDREKDLEELIDEHKDVVHDDHDNWDY